MALPLGGAILTSDIEGPSLLFSLSTNASCRLGFDALKSRVGNSGITSVDFLETISAFLKRNLFWIFTLLHLKASRNPV
jgi:hypothetical protein